VVSSINIPCRSLIWRRVRDRVPNVQRFSPKRRKGLGCPKLPPPLPWPARHDLCGQQRPLRRHRRPGPATAQARETGNTLPPAFQEQKEEKETARHVRPLLSTGSRRPRLSIYYKPFYLFEFAFARKANNQPRTLWQHRPSRNRPRTTSFHFLLPNSYGCTFLAMV